MEKDGIGERPLISVITVVHNGEEHLERTIRSVTHQTFDNFEYVIVDGGSTDGTVEIITRCEDAIDRWISEKDDGIYDAMNKGVRLSRGEWIYFLGSDDRFRDEQVLVRMKDFLKGDLAMVFGGIEYEDGRKVLSRFYRNTWLHNTIHHQSAFYRRALFENWEYDTRYGLISDYELNLMVFLGEYDYRFVDEVIAVCRSSGRSRTQLLKAFRETNAVRRKHVGVWKNGVFCALFSVKYFVSMILHAARNRLLRVPSLFFGPGL